MPTRLVDTPSGRVRLHDSGSDKPCVVLVPDGPNVIEHYAELIALLSEKFRVVVFDMPGFGFSFPRRAYRHSLDDGAKVVLGVLDALDIGAATLAFSCANGFYALRAAQLAPERITSLILSQTPSMAAMDAWAGRAIPRPIRVPVLGQVLVWLLRRRVADRWYAVALPRSRPAPWFAQTAQAAFDRGSCFCLAGVVQGLLGEGGGALSGSQVPCTLVWGASDHSHRYTAPESFLDLVPGARIVVLEGCGHFPDLEKPERYASLLDEHMARIA